MKPFDDIVEKEVEASLSTLIDFIRYGLTQAARLKPWYGHGTTGAWDEMIALTLGSLGLAHDTPATVLQAHLTASEKSFLLAQLKKRLVDKIPTPYLTHRAYFCGQDYYVDERVLIPRSPIAELIEHRFEPWINPDAVHRILDLCTGSGCIAIACAYAFPEALIDGVDLSPDALEVASMNVKHHAVEAQVTLVQSDLWEKIDQSQYDLIVSNPPYVGREEYATLPLEYHHEPKMALEAAENGLAIVKKILKQAKHYLSEHGILVVEVGASDAALIAAYPNLPFTWVELERGGEGVLILTAKQLGEWV